jgi:hypothetical protein
LQREEEKEVGGENGWSGHRNARYKRFPSEGAEDGWRGSREGREAAQGAALTKYVFRKSS